MQLDFPSRGNRLAAVGIVGVVLALLGSVFASRASAQEAWSGYLVIKASWRTSNQGVVGTANTKAAYYFDGSPASVVLDSTGVGSRVWLQRVAGTGYHRENFTGPPVTCRYVSNEYDAGSAPGTARLELYDAAGTTPARFFLAGGYEGELLGQSTLRADCRGNDRSAHSIAPCNGSFFEAAPGGVGSVALTGQRLIAAGGQDVGCSSGFAAGAANWTLTRGSTPPQCSNGIDDDGDAATLSYMPWPELTPGLLTVGIDYSAGSQFKDPECTSDADDSEAS